jgi:RHS repeat-associated protein
LSWCPAVGTFLGKHQKRYGSYYPFGLTMAGISSKSAGKLENKYKFNGGNEIQSKEFTDGDGLDMYDAINRLYNPQIGIFHQIDPLADISYSWSPYVFGSDNPILRNDPLGLKDTIVNGEKGESKELEGVIVKTKYTKKDYLKIIDDNLIKQPTNLLSFILPNFLPSRFAVIGFDPRGFQNGFDRLNDFVDIPAYIFTLIYLKSKIARGGKLSWGEKKLLWWLRKAGSDTAPFSKILGEAVLAFQLVADASEYKEGKIGVGRLIYRLGGIATQYAILGAEGAGPWGALAGLLVGFTIEGGELLYDNVIEPEVVKPIQKWLDEFTSQLKQLEDRLKNMMH